MFEFLANYILVVWSNYITTSVNVALNLQLRSNKCMMLTHIIMSHGTCTHFHCPLYMTHPTKLSTMVFIITTSHAILLPL
jgi:hypothetical protein